MPKYCACFLFIICIWSAQSQVPEKIGDTLSVVEQDSLKRSKFFKQIGNGFFPTKYIDIDLRYLIKFNQYEGFRTGLGGRTNNNLSEKYRMVGYVVYGFKDHHFKYSIGGGFRISKSTDTWVDFSYTDDLQETGSSTILTDKRFFSFFEPRLLNISLFHHHITKNVSLEHRLTPYLLSEIELSRSNITPTYDYTFFVDDDAYKEFRMTMAKISLQWNPFNTFESDGDIEIEKDGFPNFTLQLSKSFKDVLGSNFNFFKADFRTIYKFDINPEGSSFAEATLTGGIAAGKTPLTHLYHTYPNNLDKQTILQRFSVAGINSFETMYFDEFFSDKFATLQLKYYLKTFDVSKHIQPQIVFISRMALGEMDHLERHQDIEFKTLHKGYTEVGMEVNKILFGFGLSFAYRYGAYHLPEFADNVAAKFTFNISL
ncbi:hypothetical protein [Gelidibacter maritimus]|uniref:Uncharacterized protein n=1 Tax=Gelidibacter maritimus TaxID=2761487 RepID=A0A7W2M2V8_9FLAO|nr:hypothetical protein [Gelidibacter maritimus]MBA6151673.1 hypothetical protein [Gelidibacter maritimus]